MQKKMQMASKDIVGAPKAGGTYRKEDIVGAPKEVNTTGKQNLTHCEHTFPKPTPAQI